MNPCKECLIRAGCSKDCKEFKHHLETISAIMTFIAIVIAGIATVATLYFSGMMGNNVAEAVKMRFVIIWILFAVFGLVANAITGEKIKDLVVILLAPFMFYILIFIYLSSFFIRRNIRKRA